MRGLSGETAIVTASSSGLGKASATALAREGANVVLNGRDEEKLEAAIADVETEAAEGVRVLGQQGNITDPGVPDAIVEATVEEFGGLDHLVTSAGGPAPGLLLDTTDQDWYNAYDLMVMSVVRLVRAAADPLREDRGSIVNITSRTVKEASDSIVLSNSVRMAVIGLQKTLSRELAPKVWVNAIRSRLISLYPRGPGPEFYSLVASAQAVTGNCSEMRWLSERSPA